MKKPNLFIVGAAKSGTTSMMHYLDAHPEISMPQRREPVFFGSDLVWPKMKTASLDDYLAIFSDVGDVKYIGEKSVWYLYSREAASEIHEFNADARILILLRDPVDMMYSLHTQFLRTENEDLENFREAIEAQSARARGERLPPAVRSPEALLYTRVVRYAEQVERYLNVFGPDRVRVLLFEDLQQRPEATYRAVLEFLGVDPGFLPRFEVHNPARKLRSPRLHRILTERPWYYRLIPDAVRRRMEWRLHRLNDLRVRRPQMEATLREQLCAELRPDVDRLAEMLARDLGHWCQSDEP